MKKKLLRKQRFLGIVLLIISAIMVLMALNGRTLEDKNCTAVLFTLPMGLLMIFSKTVVIC